MNATQPKTQTTWCQTCGNPVENGMCCCWAHVADALQRFLGMDFDTSADMAAKLWAASDAKDRVWSAEYANDHDVEVYPDPKLTALFSWGHDDCTGTFTFSERLPHATVYACAICGQNRVQQDNPEAHGKAMGQLADALIDAADVTE